VPTMRTFSLVVSIGLCLATVPSFGEGVPFRRVEIDRAFTGDGKALGKIDSDALIDIIVGGKKLVWYRAPSWVKTTIASGVDFGTAIQVGDVDNDGDLDIIAPDSLPRSNVLWFENPRPRRNPSTATWHKHVIGTFVGIGAAHPHDVAVGDIDGNGRLDVVTRRGTTTVWLQSDTDSWTKVDLPNAAPGHEGMALGDLDNDGDLDIALNGYWMEAPREKADGAAWIKYAITPNWPADARVEIADLDKDGHLDVILSRSESAGWRLSWFGAANPKTGPWTEHVIDATVDYAHALQAADMDQDGILDVFFAEMAQSTQKRVGFFRNNGHALRWTLHVVDTIGSHNARVGDIDGDGDIDIVGANWQGPPVLLWENLSSRRGP
jgi:hypothetical protein